MFKISKIVFDIKVTLCSNTYFTFNNICLVTNRKAALTVFLIFAKYGWWYAVHTVFQNKSRDVRSGSNASRSCRCYGARLLTHLSRKHLLKFYLTLRMRCAGALSNHYQIHCLVVLGTFSRGGIRLGSTDWIYFWKIVFTVYLHPHLKRQKSY